MSFELTILGSGAAIPALHRRTTAQYLNCHQRHILIDCGEGTQLQLRKFHIKFQQIDFILISHLHGDHVFGLPGLISTMQMLGRTSELKIFGPKGIKELIQSQLMLVGHHDVFSLTFTEFEKNSAGCVYEDKCITIHHFPLNHRVQTHGYLIKEKPHKRRLIKEAFDATGVSVSYIQKLIQGEDITDNDGKHVRSDDVTIAGRPAKSYAYCSDTAFFPEIIPHIKDVDVLYHEATFIDKESERAHATYHSTAKQAATIALKANAKRLIMGHFSARYRSTKEHIEEASTIFTPCFAAEDGELYKI